MFLQRDIGYDAENESIKHHYGALLRLSAQSLCINGAPGAVAQEAREGLLQHESYWHKMCLIEYNKKQPSTVWERYS
ncbi:MAG: hypothetical protein CVV13_03280 [Gammaproteobacteria bacterium HGW-Gammaproteobacteria-3]|nr:MAG: hypothetical protein CVV13_03280 [Gammaproteobacteria bacterium HGW-Gammaproteobacteria-3]